VPKNYNHNLMDVRGLSWPSIACFEIRNIDLVKTRPAPLSMVLVLCLGLASLLPNAVAPSNPTRPAPSTQTGHSRTATAARDAPPPPTAPSAPAPPALSRPPHDLCRPLCPQRSLASAICAASRPVAASRLSAGRPGRFSAGLATPPPFFAKSQPALATRGRHSSTATESPRLFSVASTVSDSIPALRRLCSAAHQRERCRQRRTVRPDRAPALSSQARPSSPPPRPRRYDALVRATPHPSSATRGPMLEEDSTDASSR
jgi:hypothetical protein